MPVISKRKLESYKRAEKVAQEFRYQFSDARRENASSVVDYLIFWMKLSGKHCYERPKLLRKNKK